MAHAPIIVDNQAVGSVRVWVYGSDKLLRSADQDFRDKSYQAMIMAAIIAIVLASVFGYFFARSLVRPIKRMTDTAVAIKEGDLTARTALQGEDEISQLGQTFDAMADTMERDRKLERRLTTDVAHELRTPLMAIQATVEAMVDGVLPVDEERLMTVDSEVMRLSRLVDSLLKLSRLENRSNPNKKEIVDVGEVVSGIIATHEAYVREAGLTLTYRADPNVLVMGDPDLIRQATANLISNAVRYTDEGGQHQRAREARRDHGVDRRAGHGHRPYARRGAHGVPALLARRFRSRSRKRRLGRRPDRREGNRRAPRRLGAGGRPQGRGRLLHHPHPAVRRARAAPQEFSQHGAQARVSRALSGAGGA